MEVLGTSYTKTYNLEDLTNYTLLNASGTIQLTSTDIIVTDSEGAAIESVYKDFDSISGLTHKFAIKKIAKSGATGIWTITNSPYVSLQDAISGIEGISLYWSNTFDHIVLSQHVYGAAQHYMVIGPYDNYADDTWYYVTVTRDNFRNDHPSGNVSDISVSIYTDPERTNLFMGAISTMVCTGAIFNRLLTYHSYDNTGPGANQWNSVHYKDFDLGEPNYITFM